MHPSADAFVVLYEFDTRMQLAFLKVNYQDGYTHFIDNGEAGIENNLILHRALLAGKTQKADEGITIDVESLDFELIEKKYSFSGEKYAYFSTKVIDAEPIPSLEENVKVIKKVAEKIGQKFETPTYNVVADLKRSGLRHDRRVRTTLMSVKWRKKSLKTILPLSLSFQEEVAEKGFVNQAPMMRDVREISEKKFGKQKLKLSNGIELIVSFGCLPRSKFDRIYQ